MIYNDTMITDSHMHTKHFSSDAIQSIEELITASKTAGMNAIAITEHYDMDYPHKDEIMVFDIGEYQNIFPRWRGLSERLQGPELLMGIEIGWQPHLNERIKLTVSSLPFDEIILSNHLFRGVDIYYSEECALIPRKDRHKEYIGEMARMCREISDFDVAAHYDYINRYIEDPQSAVFYDDCPREFDEFFEALISKDKALEINTRSIDKQKKKKSDYIMPDPGIIRRYLDMGGKLITLGSDSHDPSTIGIHFEETSQYLYSLGVKEIYYFRGRKPVSDPEYVRLTRG